MVEITLTPQKNTCFFAEHDDHLRAFGINRQPLKVETRSLPQKCQDHGLSRDPSVCGPSVGLISFLKLSQE